MRKNSVNYEYQYDGVYNGVKWHYFVPVRKDGMFMNDWLYTPVGFIGIHGGEQQL